MFQSVFIMSNYMHIFALLLLVVVVSSFVSSFSRFYSLILMVEKVKLKAEKYIWWKMWIATRQIHWTNTATFSTMTFFMLNNSTSNVIILYL